MRIGKALGGPDQRLRTGKLADCNNDPLAGGPVARERMRPDVVEHLRIYGLRRPPQCKFSQRRQVRLPVAPRSELGPPAAAVAVLAVLGSLYNDSGVFVAAGALLAFLPAPVAATLDSADLGDTRTL